ncbi:hypothetical protein O3P69_009317 [Scylla paramamosain]|uniref:Triple QxxK/R motif-containing protein n=1 Tax=Scylla paramamosain TaxID=85552 RepID=A0AAW0TD78_SCYPA
MGRKDAQMHSLPVDHYRKQIGKQNKKQTSSNVRELKKHTEAKSSSPRLYKDVGVAVASLAVVVVVVYSLLFLWLLDEPKKTEERFVPAS